jgi:hypothetical protein
MGSKKDNILLIYVEGDSEYYFYKLLLDQLKKVFKINIFPFRKIFILNYKGSGNIKKKIVAKTKRKYLDDKKYSNCIFTVCITYDSDVFTFAPKPPFKVNEVKKELKNIGIKKVFEVKAEKCIEDWYLIDVEGICKTVFCKIKVSTIAKKIPRLRMGKNSLLKQ